MILRRVIAHFRKQEWTAIAIDFLIVVLGVFVGLQVNNWNETREKRARAEILSQRLNDDFGIDLWVASSLLDYNRTVYENALLALDDLTGAAPLPSGMTSSAISNRPFEGITWRQFRRIWSDRSSSQP